MKKLRLKFVQFLSLLLLFSMVVIFVHSELSLHQGESEEFHAEHDFSNLVSKTLQPTQNHLPEIDNAEEIQGIIEVFHFYERSNNTVSYPVSLYPRDTSLTLLFSTLLI